MSDIATIEAMLYGGLGLARRTAADANTGSLAGNRTGTTAEVAFTLLGERIALPAAMRTPLQPLAILDASPDRVAPRCEHFGTCGGCHYQHASYPAQLRVKQAILRETLANALGSSSSKTPAETEVRSSSTTLPEITMHAGDPWHYRNRIRLRLVQVDGVLRAGYNRHAAADPDPSNSTATSRSTAHQAPAFLPITMCPIAAPLLWRAAEALLDLANRERASTDPAHSTTADKSPSKEKHHEAIARWLSAAIEVELFTTPDEDALQMTLFVRGEAKGSAAQSFEALAKALQRAIPQLTGAGVAILPKESAQRSRRTERPKPGPQWGTPGLLYPISTGTSADAAVRSTQASQVQAAEEVTSAAVTSAEPFWVSRGGFFQVNRHLVATLERLATTEPRATEDTDPNDSPKNNKITNADNLTSASQSTRTGALAWDLYAGVGLFSRALAAAFDRVVAVEAAEPAASDLAQNLRRPQKKSPANPPHTISRAVVQTTLDFLRSAVLDRARPELIVMDPPRAGVGAEVCALLTRVAAPTIVYVSCDPTTLAEDLKLLTTSGYTLAELHLVDMFPQTFHIETVAILKLLQTPTSTTA